MMNLISEEDEEEDDGNIVIKTVDYHSSIQSHPEFSGNKNICSSKQGNVATDRSKYQTANRSTSLPSRQFSSTNTSIGENLKQRRRNVSDSNNNTSTSLVTSFLQCLRNELRTATNQTKSDHQRVKRKKTYETNDLLSEKFNLSNDFYRQQYPMQMSSTSNISSIIDNSNQSSSSIKSDENEISKLIDLLLLRVECINNENQIITENKHNQRSKNKHKNYPSIKQIDQNLIDYLYYLFTKFAKDESDSSMVDKTNFVNVCQTLVRSNSFNISTSISSEQSLSDSTLTNSSDSTLAQTLISEYTPSQNDLTLTDSTTPDRTSSNVHDTLIIIDLEKSKPANSSIMSSDSKYLLPPSTIDDQLLQANENYFSFEEIKSCESESSQSNYYSPDSSLVDLHNMVQEFDDVGINNHQHGTLFNEDGSASIEHTSNTTNGIMEAKDCANTRKICIGLTNESSDSNTQVTLSSMNTDEQIPAKINGKSSRREKKMQERWMTTTAKTDNNEPTVIKAFLGVEFPQISVLRQKFSSTSVQQPTSNPPVIKRKPNASFRDKLTLNTNEINNASKIDTDKSNEHNSSLQKNQTIDQTKTTATVSNKTKHNQVFDLQSNNTSSLRNCYDSETANDVQQSSSNILDLINDEKCADEDEKLNIEHEHMSSPRDIQHNETITNMNGDLNQNSHMNINKKNNNNNNNNNNENSRLMNDSNTSNVLSSSTSLLLKPCLSTSLFRTNENRTIEPLPKETEEKRLVHYDDDTVDAKKKNNRNVENNYSASRTILINGEPIQPAGVEHAKKEKEKEKEHESVRPFCATLSTVETSKQQQLENERSNELFSNSVEKLAMSHVNKDDEQYKKIEIEEIPDEEDELIEQNNKLIQPTDFILTDDEPKITQQPDSATINNTNLKYDTILSCYEKVLSKITTNVDDTLKPSTIPTNETEISSTNETRKQNQRPEDDPIALRALQRFEQHMNAAVANKDVNNEKVSAISKGKSSWSGTFSAPRKPLDNLFINNQQTSLKTTSTNEESSTTTAPFQHETFIRPRKTMLDDNNVNFGLSLNLFGTTNETNKLEEERQQQQQQQQQQQELQKSEVTLENHDKPSVSVEQSVCTDHPQQQPEHSTIMNSTVLNENYTPIQPENFSSLNPVVAQTSSEEQSFTPYRLHLEGRRRLNTLERIRQRHQNNDVNPAPYIQNQNEYAMKPDDYQDPIIRRALERFDERSRSLAQAQPMNYDDVQDPITRRALMRLETNLRRTMPTGLPVANGDMNESLYKNTYTLGSLQQTNNNVNNQLYQLQHYPESCLPPTSNPRLSHVSLHQRFCSTSSSDMSNLPTSQMISNTEHQIPIMRVPTQPVYMNANSQQQQQQQPMINVRQRSRSEEVLSSKPLSIGPTTNINDNQITMETNDNSTSNNVQQDNTLASNEIETINFNDENIISTDEKSINSNETYSENATNDNLVQKDLLTMSTKSELLSPQNEHDTQYFNPSSSSSSSLFTPVHRPPSTNNYYSQQQLSTSMYTTNNLDQTPYTDDPIVRRALERFNSQMQSTIMNISQNQLNNNYVNPQYSAGYTRQRSFDSFYSPDAQQYNPWANANRPTQSTSNTATGYQSIIGRRRHLRLDDNYHDNTSVGNAYSSVMFANQHNSYPMMESYMNFPDEPPEVPPRLFRDHFHEQPEYLVENINNNNNNNNNSHHHHHHHQQQQHNPYMHHAYAATTTTTDFRTINQQMISGDFHQYQDDDYLRNRAQSTSSTASSESVHPIRLSQQKIPPISSRNNLLQNNKSPTDQIPLQSDVPLISNNGNTAGDSVFHRLAYTATKASLSKSSSNLCASLSNKTSQQQQQQQQQQQLNKGNNFKSTDVEDDDDDELTNIESNNQDQIARATNNTSKSQRSRSVDGRARLKNAQLRANNNVTRHINDPDDNQNTTTVPSSKFTTNYSRRDLPLPRAPTSSRPGTADRPSTNKRFTSGNNLTCQRNGSSVRVRGSSGNLIDTENDENSLFNDHYQPKIIDSRPKPSLSAQRHHSSNNIQTSASTSSVNTPTPRTKIPVAAYLDRKDCNASSTDLNRLLKRTTDNRVISPSGQRRTVPVSVFSPAKTDNKTSVSAVSSSLSTSQTNDSTGTNNCDSQQEPSSSLSHSSTDDNSYTAINSTNEINRKLSATNSVLKTSTDNILNEISVQNDKFDHSKKMNVFERLFRGHKKKI